MNSSGDIRYVYRYYLPMAGVSRQYLFRLAGITPAIYIFCLLRRGLYADFGINIYYLIAAIYGWFFWMGTRGKEKSPHYTYPVEMLSATIPLCLSCLSSASPGYLSNTQTVTFRGWTVSQRR